MPPMSFAGDANFPRTPLGLCSPGSNASFFGCTTKQHNAHGTEIREVLYPWHPWFGREVHVHEVVKRGNMPVFWCSPTANRTGRCLAVPSWMFDRAACLYLYPAQAPQVDLAALDNLKTLLSNIIDRVPSAGSVIGARHPSHQSRGDADAPREPAAPNQTTQPVSAVLPRTRSNQPAQAGARHGGTPDGADALDDNRGQRGRRANGRTN
jgi:hypothetical protein